MRRLITMFVVLAMVGCQSPPPAATTAAPPDAGLLYELVSKQKQVSMILLIKRISPPTQQLVRDIADASAAAEKTLETLADKHALAQKGLPPLEQQVRDAIEAHQRKALLTAGDDAELRLLLTQVDATQYARFLAERLAAQWDDDNARRRLTDMAATFAALHDRAVERLTVNQQEQ